MRAEQGGMAAAQVFSGTVVELLRCRGTTVSRPGYTLGEAFSKHRHLRKGLGYRVHVIPEDFWHALPDDAARAGYLRAKLQDE